MSDERSDPAAGSPSWPITRLDGRTVVVFDANDVGRGRSLLSELEKTLLHALSFIRSNDSATAAAAVQAARSHVAVWAGELSSLEERLASPRE